ncbi:MAG: hypothetical protein K1000chlam2_00477 [Chlamydiae bacterium]|nr:hypothetical protein [Chlamydiota bacterium]
MDKGRGEEELSVMEAVDNLSNMAEIDLKAVPLDIEEEKISTKVNWRDPRQALRNEPLVKETFRILHRYLQNMVRRDRNAIKDTETQKGINAIMHLAREAVMKMDRYVSLYPKRYKPISKLKEYTDLEKYYRQEILGQIPPTEDVPEDFEEEFKGIEAEKRGINDLEGVRLDQNYELFFIKNENGKPYFSRSLLRHIRLMGNIDEMISKVEGEDPLLSIREFYDSELYEGAREVLRLVAPHLDEFYKEGKNKKARADVVILNKAIMALRMAANPKNLIENQSFKSCLEYYADFHRFLRDVVDSPEFAQRLLIEEEEQDYFSHIIVKVTHALCYFFFMRIEPKKEGLKLIHKIIERGDEIRGPQLMEKADEKELQMWMDLLSEDESLRFLLAHYPNGPIMRTLDAFREEEEFEGYDPLVHFNFPSQLFTFSSKDIHVTVLRLPCPVKQLYINQAEIVKEFTGFLLFLLKELKPDKHLYVNLQNRTSWEEFARCIAIEKCEKQAEYYEALYLMGLAKNSSFFLQNEEYESVGGAPVFMEQFKEQIFSGEACGFYLTENIKLKKIESFIDEAMKTVHKLFFDGKTTLTRLDRLSFIEIFYLVYVLKIIDCAEITSLSFTCKDSIDTGMAQTALFFSFLRLVSSPDPWTKEEKDELLWLLFSPALFVRDRAINQTRFKRAVMAAETIHRACLKDHKAITKGLNKLYNKLQFPLKIIR